MLAGQILNCPACNQCVQLLATIPAMTCLWAITIGYQAIAALWFVASAEVIRVFLDIQNNTHEASHFARQLFDRCGT